MAITVQIADIVVTERTVELPDNCPECGAALRNARLRGWEYQDQCRAMSVQNDIVEFDEESNEVPDSGESFISYVSLRCECGHRLANGNENYS
jgi:hypothetical protein